MRELYNAWEGNNENDDDEVLGVKYRCDASFHEKQFLI